MSDTGPSWAPSAIRTGWMEPKWPRITPPLALLSDGYPTVIRRRALVDTQFWGPRPNYPTVIRRLSDGHPTVIRRLSDGHPTVIRRLSDGNPKLVCSPKVQQKTSPTARAREGPRARNMSWERLGVEFLFCLLCVAAIIFVQLDFF